MHINFKKATADDAETIAHLVIALTDEISQLACIQPFDIDSNSTIKRCRELISDQH